MSAEGSLLTVLRHDYPFQTLLSAVVIYYIVCHKLPSIMRCMSDRIRWCPTSPELLEGAEKQILLYLKENFSGKYVDIGKIVGKETNEIWTVSSNTELKNTPAVFLHGFGSGSALWCLNYDSIAADRPVYTTDIIGFGRSSRPKFDKDPVVTEEQFCSAIEAWRKKVNLDKFILVGHSFGGYLAAAYSLKYPERISHLVLADPWGLSERPPNEELRIKLPTWAKVFTSVVQRFNPLGILRAAGPWGPRLLQNARPDLNLKFESVLPDAATLIPNYLYHCNAQTPSGETAFHHLMSDFAWAKNPIINRIDSLPKDVPMTLIYGARSWVQFVEKDPGFNIQRLRQESYVDVQILEGAGHHVYADRAESFNQILARVGRFTDEGSLPELPMPTPNNAPSESLMSGRKFSKYIKVQPDSEQTTDNDFSKEVEFHQ